MDRLTVDALAMAAGVDADTVRKFVDAGVLVAEAPETFGAADVAKTRLVAALLDAGFQLDDLAKAIRDGRFSLRFVEHLIPELARLVPLPADRESEELLAQEQAIRPILGTDRSAGEPIREDDLEILRLAARAVELGAPIERVVRIVRSFGQVAMKLVDLQRDFVDEVIMAPAMEKSGSPIAALELTARDRREYRDLGRRVVMQLMDRFLEDAILKNLVQLTELALDAGGVGAPDRQQAVVFVDVSDYTKLSQWHGDAETARQAALLTDLVHDRARIHGGRLVKSLGDGAMAYAPSAGQGLALALDLVTTSETVGLWPLHAGVNTGHMVRLDGDYFGTAVNIAARVAGQAQSGQVVVTRAVMDAMAGDDSVRFTTLGPVSLKNVSEPVELFRAERR